MTGVPFDWPIIVANLQRREAEFLEDEMKEKEFNEKAEALEKLLNEHGPAGAPASRALSAGTISTLENVGFAIVLQVLRDVIRSQATKDRLRKIFVTIRDMILIAYPLESPTA